MPARKSLYFIVLILLLQLYMPLLSMAASSPFLPLVSAAKMKLTNKRALIFATQQEGFSGTIRLSPNAGDSGSFNLKGPANQVGAASVEQLSIVLRADNSKTALTVNDFTYGGNLQSDGSFHLPAGRRRSVLTDMNIGATVTIPQKTPAGDYVGEAVLSATINKRRVDSEFQISLIILPAEKIETERGMTFPLQSTSFVGSETIQPTDPGAAVFNASGPANTEALLKIVPSTLWLTQAGVKQKIRVNHFVFGGYSGISARGQLRFPAGTGNTEADGIMLGATAEYPENLPAGTYHHVGTIQIIYY